MAWDKLIHLRKWKRWSRDIFGTLDLWELGTSRTRRCILWGANSETGHIGRFFCLFRHIQPFLFYIIWSRYRTYILKAAMSTWRLYCPIRFTGKSTKSYKQDRLCWYGLVFFWNCLKSAKWRLSCRWVSFIQLIAIEILSVKPGWVQYLILVILTMSEGRMLENNRCAAFGALMWGRPGFNWQIA